MSLPSLVFLGHYERKEPDLIFEMVLLIFRRLGCAGCSPLLSMLWAAGIAKMSQAANCC
jgi:hypothetical protein